MPLELAQTEEEVLTNLAILKAHGRDLLGDELIKDIRQEVDSRTGVAEYGPSFNRAGSAQASRIMRLSKKGKRIVRVEHGACLMSDPECAELIIVDNIGRVFKKGS